MRLLKLSTPWLAAIFGGAIEALFAAAFFAFGTFTPFGTNTNFWSKSFFWFHQLAGTVTDFFVEMGHGSNWQDITGFVICFSFGWLQWWIVCLVAIWLIRFFQRKAT